MLFFSALLVNDFEAICNLIFESVDKSLKEKNLMTDEIGNYLSELKRFMFMTKKDLFADAQSIKTANFNYDFQEIQRIEYKVNPNSILASKNPIKFDFYHDKDQQKLISNQLRLYDNRSQGLGMLFQKTNLKRIFRNFCVSAQ